MLSVSTPYAPYASMPRSSSPLNPLRSSSPPHPLSSPTPSGHTPLPLTFMPRSNAGSSPRPLSARYTRGSTTRGSPRPTAPKPSRELVPPDLFIESASNTPTQGAMWCNRLARRMADRELKKRRREDALTRFRGMSDLEEPEDEDERERQAQADDEEIFRRLMVLQRRREQHAALVSHETETGGSDPALPDFWEEEADALAREERALYQHLNASFGDPEDELEREAAAAEEAEAAAEAEELAWAERAERQARGPDEFDEADWAAIAALQDDEDEPMDIELSDPRHIVAL